jgi:hypothetical protein
MMPACRLGKITTSGMVAVNRSYTMVRERGTLWCVLMKIALPPLIRYQELQYRAFH